MEQDAGGVALSGTVREMALPWLPVAEKSRGRTQFDSRRTRAAMSGKVAAIDGASGCGAGIDEEQKSDVGHQGGREAPF